MGDCSGMSISADSSLDEILNRGPLALLLRRQYEFPFGINIVQFFFSIFHGISFREKIITCVQTNIVTSIDVTDFIFSSIFSFFSRPSKNRSSLSASAFNIQRFSLVDNVKSFMGLD